jgi:hypothetical protein
MMKVIVVFKRLLASGNDLHGSHLFKWAAISSILLKEMRYLVHVYKISMGSVHEKFAV